MPPVIRSLQVACGILALGPACSTDGGGPQTAVARELYLYNVTTAVDLRARVEDNGKVLGTFPVPPGLQTVKVFLGGGHVVETTVLDASGAIVSVGSCTVSEPPFSYATVAITPAVSCGCGFQEYPPEGGNPIPCNP